MVQTITLSHNEMEQVKDLLSLTGSEIYKKYGYKRDDTIVHTVKFPNDIEIDIKLVIREHDTPYTEGVLFQNGCEQTGTGPMDTYAGKWRFHFKNTEYIVMVEEGK